GADEVIAIDLHTSPSHPNYVGKPYVTYIAPSRSLGTMLNFDRQIIEDNMELGYYDTMKLFGYMTGKKYQFYEEDFAKMQEPIRDFVTKVARTEAYLTEGTLGRLVKPGDGKRLCGTIEDHVIKQGKDYTREDYFAGAAEICGEIFGIESKNPWHLKDFLKEVLGGIQEREYYQELAIFDGKSKVELASNLADWKIRKKSADIVGCIYYGYKLGKIDLTEQIGILTLLPYELAASLLLLTVD
ncbi:MAG: hypothetical protein RSD28_03795, partial [Lachnospiraceae bacterium]